MHFMGQDSHDQNSVMFPTIKGALRNHEQRIEDMDAMGMDIQGLGEALQRLIRVDPARIGEVRPYEVRPSEVRRGEVRPSEMRSVEPRPGEVQRAPGWSNRLR